MFGSIGWVAMDDPLQWVPASNDDDAAASNGRFAARLCIARSVKRVSKNLGKQTALHIQLPRKCPSETSMFLVKEMHHYHDSRSTCNL